MLQWTMINGHNTGPEDQDFKKYLGEGVEEKMEGTYGGETKFSEQGCKNALIFLTHGTAIFNLPD